MTQAGGVDMKRRESAEKFPTLTFRRLRLRQVAQRDIKGLYACFGDHSAMRFWDFPMSMTVADTKKIVAWLSKTSSPYDRLAWTVADANDRCIGMINYHHRE